MKKLLFLLFAAIPALAQYNPPAVTATALYQYASAPSTCTVGQVYVLISTFQPYYCSVANTWTAFGSGGGGGGTVTAFSAGTLSPLFTTSVATSTTTPALSFTLSTQTANLFFAGPASGSAAAPTFRALVNADFPNTLAPTFSGANLTNLPASGGNYVNLGSVLSATGCTIASGICTVSATPSSVTISSIPGIYLKLILDFNGATSNAASSQIDMQFNGDTGSNYDSQFDVILGSGRSAGGNTGMAEIQIFDISGTAVTHSASTGTISIPGYAGTTFFKSANGSSQFALTSGPGTVQYTASGQWRNQAAITSITFFVDGGGNFATGTTIAVYGVN